VGGSTTIVDAASSTCLFLYSKYSHHLKYSVCLIARDF